MAAADIIKSFNVTISSENANTTFFAFLNIHGKIVNAQKIIHFFYQAFGIIEKSPKRKKLEQEKK